MVFWTVTPCGLLAGCQCTVSICSTLCNDIYISPPLESTATHTTGAEDDENEGPIDTLEMKTLNDNFQPPGSNIRQHRRFLGHFYTPPGAPVQAATHTVNDNQPG
jgi:hypothetical protein